jgi:hypothetical protein
MKRYIIVVAALVATIDPSLAQVACPNPVPDNPTREEVVACMRDIQRLRKDMESRVLQLENRKALDHIETFYTAGNGTVDGTDPANVHAECPAGSRVISGYCQSGNDARAQNFGVLGNGWTCVWRPNAPTPIVKAFCARDR